jgi:ABC-type nitrate/sulfonate/bicarbonate transport system ATPase subunit
MSSDRPVLQTTGLSLGYVDRLGQPNVTIRDLDLRIGAGEFLCLLGPSGCGKTTLLKALGGFLPPMEGAVLYQGRELPAPTPEIVMIFQENNLYPWLTVEKNIAFGPRMRGMPADRIRALTQELLTTVGLLEARHQYPHELSGGMRQRVAIARALAANSRVLLLDEPFSALDVSLRRRMQAFLRSVWRSSSATLVMVTHSIEEAILVGERVLVLGANQTGVLEDIDVRSPALKDRYAPEFLQLQRRLEKLLDDDSDPDRAAA